MNRSLLAVLVAASLASAAPCVAATPGPQANPSPRATKRPAFSNKIHSPNGKSSRVSAADCNARGTGVGSPGGQLGPNGASTSQTLIAVPVGSGSVSEATRQAQIAEACAHHGH